MQDQPQTPNTFKNAAERARPPRVGRATVIASAIVLLLLGALGAFQLVLKPAMIRSFMSKSVPPPATISTEAARTQPWVSRLPSVGSLTAIQGIDVSTQVAGVVTSIGFESGQTVSAKTKLLTLDDAVEQADLANNKALLQQTELDLNRQNDLAKRSYASDATQQAAQAKRDSAAAAVQRTMAVIAQKSIYAAFDGKLGIRRVEIGQYVSPGTSLVTLQALDPIRVDFPVPEQETSRLKIKQAIEVTVDAFPGQVFKGEIESLDARINLDTRTLLVRARLQNPDKKLLPGMFANVSVLAASAPDRVTIPRTAITYSLFGDSVFVVKNKEDTGSATAGPDQNQTVERRFVRAGEVREDRVVVDEGIAPGDQVVVSGQLKLQNGARVKVDNTVPLTPQPNRPRL